MAVFFLFARRVVSSSVASSINDFLGPANGNQAARPFALSDNESESEEPNDNARSSSSSHPRAKALTRSLLGPLGRRFSPSEMQFFNGDFTEDGSSSIHHPQP